MFSLANTSSKVQKLVLHSGKPTSCALSRQKTNSFKSGRIFWSRSAESLKLNHSKNLLFYVEACTQLARMSEYTSVIFAIYRIWYREFVLGFAFVFNMHNMASKIGNQMPARTHFTELLTFSQHFSSI